jgi:predicted RNA-binding Zn-ribbon protein involved in translation (DUF1610 family)
MARATCRCGQTLEIPREGVEHVTCPRCSAKVRLIRKRRGGDASASGIEAGDEFIRFNCPCGRRLKVSALDRPSHGKCPDCGQVVPVPTGGGLGGVESPTEELEAADVAMLEAWTESHLARGNGNGKAKGNGERPISTADMPMDAPGRRAEAGFRVCPRCGKPIHLNADTCRGCGTAVPKR